MWVCRAAAAVGSCVGLQRGPVPLLSQRAGTWFGWKAWRQPTARRRAPATWPPAPAHAAAAARRCGAPRRQQLRLLLPSLRAAPAALLPRLLSGTWRLCSGAASCAGKVARRRPLPWTLHTASAPPAPAPDRGGRCSTAGQDIRPEGRHNTSVHCTWSEVSAALCCRSAVHSSASRLALSTLISRWRGTRSTQVPGGADKAGLGSTLAARRRLCKSAGGCGGGGRPPHRQECPGLPAPLSSLQGRNRPRCRSRPRHQCGTIRAAPWAPHLVPT